MDFFGRDKIWIFAGFAIAVFISLCWIEMIFPVVIFLSGILIGLFLIFSKENEKIIIKKIKPEANLEPKKFNKKSLHPHWNRTFSLLPCQTQENPGNF